VQTFAGSGFAGLVNGVGQQTMFNYPSAVVADTQSDLFVWDWHNGVIRKITSDGTVSTFASPIDPGNFIPTYTGAVVAMAIDHNGTIFLGFTSSDINLRNSLFKIASAGTITLFSNGSAPFLPFGGGIKGLCADSVGSVFVSLGNANGQSGIQHQIYRLSTNNVWSVFAGSANSGYADGNGIFTAFNGPSALAADAADNIYVWDSGNNLIRRIDQSQNVTTFAGKYGNSSNADGFGTNAAFNSIYQMCFDSSGNLILACGTCIRRISATTNVTTVAGSFSQAGYTNGAGTLARFNGAKGVCVAGGTLCIADSGNQRIRSITNNPTTQPVLPANLQLNIYPGLQIAGTVGRTYQIQSSPDMSNWTTRATLLLNSSPYLWVDQNAVSGKRFYRAMLLP